MTRALAPDCLESQGRAWCMAFKQARRADKKHPFRWPAQHYQQIRVSLGGSTDGHCAFCDGILGITSPTTIEHFLPKSRFPGAAFHWRNLYPCCYSCQLSKGEQYEHGLLRPDGVGYRFSDHFIVDFATGKIGPLPSLAGRDLRRVEDTIRLYGLDSPERNAARRDALAEADGRDPVDPSARNFRYLFF